MLLHGDNFAPYGGNAALMLNGVYAENGGCTLVNDPDGISPGKVLRPGWNGLSNTNTNWRYILQTGGASKCGVALRVWNSTLPNDNSFASTYVQFRDNGNNWMISFAALSTGALRVITFDNAGNPTNYDSTLPQLSAQGWYHLEIWVTHTGVGTFSISVRVETFPVAGLTNIAAVGVRDSDVFQIAAFHTEIGAHAQEYFVKDLVICNGSGARNNDFVGSALVTNQVTTSDVALNWGLTGGAAGWSILDNIPPNDAQFIYALHSAPPAGPYVATISPLPVDTTSVKGIITYVRAAKTDGGDGSLQVGVKSGASTALGANRPITIAQTYWRDVFEVDPATGAAWLPGAVNAANLQIDRTT